MKILSNNRDNEREILRLDEKGGRGVFASKSKEKLVIIC